MLFDVYDFCVWNFKNQIIDPIVLLWEKKSEFGLPETVSCLDLIPMILNKIKMPLYDVSEVVP